MADELRRKILKGVLAGGAFLLGSPIISSSIFKEKESAYGLNLTKRMGNGAIVDNSIYEFIEYSRIKIFFIHIGNFLKNRYDHEFSNNINGERVVPEDKYIFDLIEKL